MSANNEVLKLLDTVLAERKASADTNESYVASLHAKGLNKILQKLGEECTETIIAAKDAELTCDSHDVVYETADLWFHSLIMLSHLGLDSSAVLQELERRCGTSGIEEKAQRAK